MAASWQCLLVVLAAIVSCAFALPTANGTFSDCDPIDPEYCAYPFPNNFWLRKDPSTKTGFRVHFGATTLPRPDFEVKHIDPNAGWNSLDGFSPMPSIVSYFPDLLLDERLPRQWNIETSLRADCPTVLLDGVTGERIAHWVELDHTSPQDEKRTFILWPAARLQNNHRYIVAFRGLMDVGGAVYAPSVAFRDLRDKITSRNFDVEGRRDLFEEIFGLLARVNIERKSLQLAWDFNTGSREEITRRLLHMRDDATARLPAGGPEYRILGVERNYSTHIHSKISGEMDVPYYTNTPLPGSHLVIGDDGLPVFQGSTPVEFTVLIPRSLIANGTAGRIVQYGHGLLGNQGEVTVSYLQEEADRNGWVLAATDWWGLCDDDVPSVAVMIATNLSDFRIVPDRSQQGVLNFLMLMKVVSGNFAKDPVVTFNGKSVVNPALRNYFGNSQGGIMGGVYMSVTTDVERGTLGVMGMPYGILLPRSADFSQLFSVLKSRLLSPFDRYFALCALQMLWDRAEPNGYLDGITVNTLPNTPSHRVLMHNGLGDAQVSYLGANIMARAAGCVVFKGDCLEGNETRYDFDVLTASSTSTQNVFVTFDFGSPVVPPTNIPPNKATDVHEKPRRDPRAQEQMRIFFETGNIVDTCNGQGCHPLP